MRQETFIGSSSEADPQGLQLKARLLDSAPDGVIAHSIDGRLLYFNEAAHRQLGYTRQEFAELPPWGWVSPRQRREIQRRKADLCEVRSLKFRSENVMRSGVAVPVEVHLTLLPEDIVIACIYTCGSDAEERMRYLAFHDPLTGLANRVLLEETLQAAIDDVEAGGVLGIVYLDVDDLRVVNKVYGRPVGDEVLKMLASRMLGRTRDGDLVGRLAADEFGLVVVGMPSRDRLASFAEDVAGTVGQPMEIDSLQVQVGVRLGIAAYEPGDSPVEMLARAEAALNRARRLRITGSQEFMQGCG